MIYPNPNLVGPTPPLSANDNRFATTAFVQSLVAGGGTTDFSGRSLTLSNPIAENRRALDIFQTGFTGVIASPLQGNRFIINSDNAALGTVGGEQGVGWFFNYFFGGVAMSGARTGVFMEANFTAATDPLNPPINRFYAAGAAVMNVNSGDGGTNTGAGAKGAFGSFGMVLAVTGAATNLASAVACEIDVNAQTGSSMGYKAGLAVVGFGFALGGPADTVHGANLDCGISISRTVNSVGFNTALSFNNQHGGGPTPGTGTLIGTSGTWATNVGIDFSDPNITFNNAAFKGPGGFAVGSTGSTIVPALAVLTTAVIPTIYAVGAAGGAATLNLITTSGAGAGDKIALAGGNNGATTFATFNNATLSLGNTVGGLVLGVSGSAGVISVDGGGGVTDANLILRSKGNSGIMVQSAAGGTIAFYVDGASGSANTNFWTVNSAPTTGAILIGAAPSSFDPTVHVVMEPKGVTGQMLFKDGGLVKTRLTMFQAGTASTSPTTGTVTIGDPGGDSSGLGVNGKINAGDNIGVASGKVYTVNAVQVVAARRTGWTAWTGTATRTSVATGAATTLNCAEAIKALIDDLIAHGLIGT